MSNGDLLELRQKYPSFKTHRGDEGTISISLYFLYIFVQLTFSLNINNKRHI